MADPFEVRMRFTTQLQHLNASVTAAQKAANYALKHREMDEDLHSCILEQLERVHPSLRYLLKTVCANSKFGQNNMNNRANIMYFIEHLCDASQRESHPMYIHMMRRDILRVIDAVAPSDGSGAANVKVVRRVLAGLQAKSVLLPQTVVELEECLKERDIVAGQETNGDVEMEGAEPLHGNGVLASTPRGGRNGMRGPVRLDKRQVEQRIEEDRERHKRQRETAWAVPGEEEYEKVWEEGSDAGEDDVDMGKEDTEQRLEAVRHEAVAT